MYIKIGCVRIHVGFPFAAFCAYAANYDYANRLMAVFVSALLHEAGHGAVLAGFGDKSLTLVLSPGGAKINSRLLDELSYKRELAVAAAGPAVNLLIATGLFITGAVTEKTGLFDTAYINLALGLVNLLPMTNLDGGRILSAVLMSVRDYDSARRTADRVGVAVFAVLSVTCVCLLLSGKNVVYLAVFLVYCAVQKRASRHLK